VFETADDHLVLDLDGEPTLDLGGGRHPSRRTVIVPPRL
jgi:hypothetical protein